MEIFKDKAQGIEQLRVMLHFLSVHAATHLEKAADLWCVRLSKQNSITVYEERC